MPEKPDYYQILYVRPDAPIAIIKASFRTLMHKLGQHPDAGGDTKNAFLINEAYTVLSDPQARAAYDQNLRSGLNERPPETEFTAPQTSSSFAASSCAFCGEPYLGTAPLDPEVCCKECGSSLHPVSRMCLKNDLRRAVTRVRRDGDLTYFTQWPGAEHPALIHNLSPNGIRLVGSSEVTVEQRIKISSELLAAVARVRHCRSVKGEDTSYDIGAEFVTLHFKKNSGIFMARSA
jgi:hypothetical protein